MKYGRAIWWLIAIVILAFFPLWDLTRTGLPVTHDGVDHVARIANFYASLSEGHIVPRWASNLNWGYGHPILMFLYPLPSYVASLFHAVGFTFVDSTKLVFAFAYVFSTVFMYLWLSHAFGAPAGFTAAVVYSFAPYRFVDLYVRGAIGEHMAFVFPPLICLGMYKLARQDERMPIISALLIAFGTAFLILSHNALSLVFLPVIGCYMVYCAAHEAKQVRRFVIVAAASLAFGFLLSAFYWMPAFFEGKYTLRDIVTRGEFTSRFTSWFSFLYSPWSYGGGNEISKWLGAGQLLAIALSFSLITRGTKFRHAVLGCFAVLALTMFLMTEGSEPVWATVSILQKFQFPWRLLSLCTFVIALISAIVVHAVRPKVRLGITALLVGVSIAGTAFMWRAREYKVYEESYFTGTYNGTTDTGESSPIWSVRFMETRPKAPAFLVPPLGTVVPIERTTVSRSYSVTARENVRFVENTLYFPGWNVSVDGKPLSTDRLMFQDPAYRGLMTFELMPGDHTVRFVFSETKLRRFADMLSLGAVAAFFAALGTIRLLWQKKR